MCHRYRYQLLRLPRKCSVGENALTEGFEGLGRTRSKLSASIGKIFGWGWIDLFLLGHDFELL
jgi:hypothetical protein